MKIEGGIYMCVLHIVLAWNPLNYCYSCHAWWEPSANVSNYSTYLANFSSFAKHNKHAKRDKHKK